jgi:hypothetical protein
MEITMSDAAEDRKCGFELTTMQETALRVILYGRNGEMVAGYAGTGKSTVLAEAAKRKPGIIFVAPTNKAAKVLLDKGIPRVTTIHKLGQMLIAVDDKGRPVFEPLPPTETSVRIVIDEASMVTMRMFRDLQGTFPQATIIMVGDGFQLPPIGGEPAFDARRASVVLTEVHRQDAGPVLTFATALRSGDDVQLAEFFEPTVIDKDLAKSAAAGQTAIIVSTNGERIHYVKTIRRWLVGDPTLLPEPGERLLAYAGYAVNLGSRMSRFIINGETAVVVECFPQDDPCEGRLLLRLDDGVEFYATIHIHEMLDPAQQQTWQAARNGFSGAVRDPWAFSYAMTAHKSQGSQWPVVCLKDAPPPHWMDGDRAGERWLYTAVTRAEKEVRLLR